MKTILTIIFLMISAITFAQRDGDAKTSFGIRGYNYMEMPKMLHQTDDHNFVSSAFSSYIIKFNHNLFSYRLNGSYLNKSIAFSNNCEGCALAHGKVKDYSFKTGFEKNFIYGNVQPYIAFDLGYRSNEFNRDIEEITAQDLISASRKRGLTITPSLGIKISPIREICFFAEGNFEYFYAWGKETSVNAEDSGSRTATKFKKGEYLINPVSVGIQVHLGKTK